MHYFGSPAGLWILYSERPSDDPRFPFGTIDFAHQLPPDVALDLDLMPLGQVNPGCAIDRAAFSGPATRRDHPTRR